MSSSSTAVDTRHHSRTRSTAAIAAGTIHSGGQGVGNTQADASLPMSSGTRMSVVGSRPLDRVPPHDLVLPRRLAVEPVQRLGNQCGNAACKAMLLVAKLPAITTTRPCGRSIA